MGDNVYIGPNVCIIENVRIGNNVTIGAGAIVVKDIPDNATVAGNPAKIISYNDHSDLRLRVWKNNI
ncbi:transferase [Prevotella intermedia]|uniref:transferase n=1 Tax=Prevotella intermedia TaxID=28131 RepID=UPI00397B748B